MQETTLLRGKGHDFTLFSLHGKSCGKKKTSSSPTQSNREVNINVTIEMYDDKGVQLKTADLVTDENGKVLMKCRYCERVFEREILLENNGLEP